MAKQWVEHPRPLLRYAPRLRGGGAEECGRGCIGRGVCPEPGFGDRVRHRGLNITPFRSHPLWRGGGGCGVTCQRASASYAQFPPVRWLWPLLLQLPLLLPLPPRRAIVTATGGGGVMSGRISAIQILYEVFVRNLFGVFKDLCKYTLGIASAQCFS